MKTLHKMKKLILFIGILLTYFNLTAQETVHNLPVKMTQVVNDGTPTDPVIVIGTDGLIKSVDQSSLGGGGSVDGAYLETLEFTLESGTVSPPASSSIRFNNANISSATAMYVSLTNLRGATITDFAKLITSGSQIYFQEKNNAQNFAMFEVTSPVTELSGNITIPITFNNGGGTITTGTTVMFEAMINTATSIEVDPIYNAEKPTLDQLAVDQTITGDKVFAGELRVSGNASVPWEATLVPNLLYLYDNYRPIAESGYADETLASGDIVFQVDNTYTWRKASATDLESVTGRLGFVSSGGTVGQQITITAKTQVASSGMDPNKPIYLSETAGDWTQILPSNGYARVVAAPISTNAFFFDGETINYVAVDGTEVNGVPMGTGNIGGTISTGQLAIGSATPNEIVGTPALTFNAGSLTVLGGISALAQVEAGQLQITGGTNDDVLLGDGSTTSLSGIGAGTIGGTIANRQVPFGNGTDALQGTEQFKLNTDGELVIQPNGAQQSALELLQATGAGAINMDMRGDGYQGIIGKRADGSRRYAFESNGGAPNGGSDWQLITYNASGGSGHYITAASYDQFNVNPQEGDVDFLVGGDTDPFNLYSDASTDRIGIGTNTPTAKLDVIGDIRATGEIFTDDAFIGGIYWNTQTISWTTDSGNNGEHIRFIGGTQITLDDANVNLGNQFTILNDTGGDIAIGFGTGDGAIQGSVAPIPDKRHAWFSLVEANTWDVVVGGSGGSGGSSTLSGLDDVDTAGASNGDALTFNSSSGKWEPLSSAGAGDMLKTTYDTNADDVVDDAERLGNVLPTNYARTDVAETFSSTIAASNLSGTNTGDNATNTQYSSLVSNATHTGDVAGATALTIQTDAVDIPMLSATGTADATTYLRGDNTWATVSGGGGGDAFLANTQTFTGINTFSNNAGTLFQHGTGYVGGQGGSLSFANGFGFSHGFKGYENNLTLTVGNASTTYNFPETLGSDEDVLRRIDGDNRYLTPTTGLSNPLPFDSGITTGQFYVPSNNKSEIQLGAGDIEITSYSSNSAYASRLVLEANFASASFKFQNLETNVEHDYAVRSDGAMIITGDNRTAFEQNELLFGNLARYSTEFDQPGNFEIANKDLGRNIDVDSTVDVTLTIPNTLTRDLQGSEFFVTQLGTGKITIVGGSNQVIYSKMTTPKTGGQYHTIKVRFFDNASLIHNWIVTGEMENN